MACLAKIDVKMLNNSDKDKENLWKFYRTDAWLIFIDDQSLPVPFNCWSLLTSWVTRCHSANESAVFYVAALLLASI